jgi:F-type H+-transporting ATPase subunit delta
MSVETVARRYASALADAVLASDQSETVKRELTGWGELFGSNPDLHTVFSNPAIIHGNKEKVLDELIARTRPSGTTANFLRILLQNGRLAELGSITDKFSDVLEQRGGVVSAQITSARELPENERSEFEQNLERLTGKKINVAYAVDKDIIGGVVTRIGSTVYDNSVKTKLENLREQLVNG